ncbi:MAG: cytochrome c [Deltaproteobacteria bacterium]|nr:cytochrome c [Deltaproteobacteria bacterium]
MKKKIVLGFGFLVLCFLAGGRSVQADSAVGKAKFEQICAACHGADGKGGGPAAQGLAIRPRDLSATKRTDAELKKIIKEGGPAVGLSPLMPPWGGALSDQEIEAVLGHIRSLSKPSK